MDELEPGERLRRDGVVPLAGALSRPDLAMVEACFDWNIRHASANAVQFQPTRMHPGRFYQDINNPGTLEPDSPYWPLLTRSALGPILSDLWGGTDVWFLYEQVLLKEGGEARRTPWHQDSSYLPVAGEMLAVVWITLEETPRENSLEFVRASHRGPLYNGSTFNPEDDTEPLYAGDAMPPLPDIERARENWPILGWAVSPGDIVVFHPAMLHGGAPTRPNTRRRTVSLRFFGEDAVYAPLPSDGVEGIGIEGETIWKRLAGRLKAGDPLHDPGLPLVYRHQPPASALRAPAAASGDMP
ncbi:MAG: phytanoyl-CoA dioxygenase [Alphaproteobacteria bacterium]|nr:phytanoyl-CoA dioxygenase [Alphaproteobacteria bacterium]